ncbi:peptidoglycan-binding protein [Rhizobium sp. YJ-22]|uniref:peptidoglycan-binding protein n=1 Tax=Rhizobium sp. YJ-22 TaxID=3037556 RepID=UPI002412D325|nr:peptidoglycan-binding protein [Rhizobium sp. YJ-22]MDG3580398.1 peptidoglycan-binding protein [Rhizobium sp. YJ-22]
MEQSITSILTTELLCRVGGPVPDSKASARRGHAGVLAEHLPPLMQRFEIDRPLRIAHFLAQTAHESDSFCAMEEYASGAAYEGRADLGNVQAGDGKRYKGRGPIQLTGRTNYRAFTGWMRENVSVDVPDFEARPELVVSDRWVAYSAIYFWATRGLNRHADRDDIFAVTSIINGGRNGIEDRKTKLARAKVEIARAMASATLDTGRAEWPILHRGLMNDKGVERLQYWLVKADYPISIDGDFGPATELALKDWQRRRGLPPTGIANGASWAMLTGD